MNYIYNSQLKRSRPFLKFPIQISSACPTLQPNSGVYTKVSELLPWIFETIGIIPKLRLEDSNESTFVSIENYQASSTDKIYATNPYKCKIDSHPKPESYGKSVFVPKNLTLMVNISVIFFGSTNSIQTRSKRDLGQLFGQTRIQRLVEKYRSRENLKVKKLVKRKKERTRLAKQVEKEKDTNIRKGIDIGVVLKTKSSSINTSSHVPHILHICKNFYTNRKTQLE